jgi:hypothetical protein
MKITKSSIPISKEFRVHLNFLKLKLGLSDYETLIKELEKKANLKV